MANSKFRYFVIISLFLVGSVFTNSSFAFNKDRCGELFPTSDGEHPPWWAPLYVSTMIPSTGSYIFSTGACSMYGDSGSKGFKAHFIKRNREQLQLDGARGEGEYLSALATLSGCDERQRKQFGVLIQSKYHTIFKTKANDELVLAEAEQICKGI